MRKLIVVLLLLSTIGGRLPAHADSAADAEITALELQMVRTHNGPFEAGYLVDPDTGAITATLQHAAKPSEGLVADLVNLNYNDMGLTRWPGGASMSIRSAAR